MGFHDSRFDVQYAGTKDFYSGRLKFYTIQLVVHTATMTPFRKDGVENATLGKSVPCFTHPNVFYMLDSQKLQVFIVHVCCVCSPR